MVNTTIIHIYCSNYHGFGSFTKQQYIHCFALIFASKLYIPLDDAYYHTLTWIIHELTNESSTVLIVPTVHYSTVHIVTKRQSLQSRNDHWEATIIVYRAEGMVAVSPSAWLKTQWNFKSWPTNIVIRYDDIRYNMWYDFWYYLRIWWYDMMYDMIWRSTRRGYKET